MTADINLSLQRAVSLHGQGAVAEAAQLYEEILRTWPEHPDALHLLGVAETQLGRPAKGLDLIGRSLAINPSQPVAMANSGNALMALQKPHEALASYERALTLWPEHVLAHNGRGNALIALGRPEDALASFERALRLAPDFVEALNGRGNALLRLKRTDEAIASYDRTLLLQSDHFQALFNRGVARADLHRFEQALADQDRAIEIAPTFAQAHSGRGYALLGLKRPREALSSFNRALTIAPGYVEALVGRGNAHFELKDSAAALAAYDEVLQLNADATAALLGRASVLLATARYQEAADCLRRVRRIEPQHAASLGSNLHAQLHVCDWSDYGQAIEDILVAVENGSCVDIPASFLAMTDSPALQLQWARQLNNRFRTPEPPLWRGERYRHDRIRIAYISADFLEHPTSYLMAGLFERHDRERFQTIAVSLRDDESSPMARRIRAAFERFVAVSAKSDAEIARLIRELEVDIAVDLMGYTAAHRTHIFSHRPAPIQVSYLGFPGTMGTTDLDYIVADDFLIPNERRTDYSEQVVYLPDCFQPNDDKRPRPTGGPKRSEVGLPDSSFVWCAFHSFYKLNPAMFDVWARLLVAVPDSVLWLVGGNRAVEQNLRREGAARGVDPQRLVFADRLPYAQHLARLPLADLYLDTLPYNGGATTSDALWAGVPVVTCPGRSYAARMSGSLLHALEMLELVAATLTQYEQIALHLARAPDHLASLRTALLHRVATRPLFQTDRLRRHLESAFTTMVERGRRNEPPASLRIQAIGY